MKGYNPIMEFRRFEVRKILRHAEQVKDQQEIKKLLETIKSYALKCSIDVKEIGATMQECSILEVGDDKVLLFSRIPSKIKAWFDFVDVKVVEVDSNLDLMVEEDDGGRWARII